MVSQIGLNPVVNQTLPATNPVASGLSIANSGLASQNGLSPSGNNYTNDVMMASLDFDKILGSVNQQMPVSQNNQLTFGSNQQVENTGQTETSVADEQESGNSNIAKIVCATSGFLAPLAGKLYKWAKGANPKTLFKFKQLAVTCPVLGVAGLGIGMLLDACLDAKKASDMAKEQKVQLAQNQNITIPPQKLNSVA